MSGYFRKKGDPPTTSYALGQVFDLQTLNNFTFQTPSSPPTTSSTSGVMGGLAITRTPFSTGTMRIIVSAMLSNSGAGDGAFIKAYFGAGSPPSSGASPPAIPAGTTLLNPTAYMISPAANNQYTVCALGLAVGLIVGVTYWFDIVYGVVTAGFASITNNTIVMQVDEVL